MLSYRDIQRTIEQTGIDTQKPAVLHVSDQACQQVRGGAETLAGALAGIFPQSMVPAFTSQTMVIPPVGPENNGLMYGEAPESNLEAEPFDPMMPVDRDLGEFAETFRQHKDALRSMHPLLSFAGIGISEALADQTYVEPLAPVENLLVQDANILMIGSGHSQNISIHLGERLAGRKKFVRWARTPNAIAECPEIPGCPDGFDAIDETLNRMEIRTGFGEVSLRVIKMKDVVKATLQILEDNPLALLCQRPGCLLCDAVRADVQGMG